MRYFLLLIVLYSASLTLSAQALTPLTLHSQVEMMKLHFTLDDEEWRWVGEKKTLRIATWEPQNPPIDIIHTSNLFEGISADYLKIIGDQLNIKMQLLRYPSRSDALMALEYGAVDMLIDDPGTPERNVGTFSSSLPFIADYPALIAREETEKNATPNEKAFSLAVPENYLTDEQIHSLYPNAVVTRFSSTQSAMAALAYKSLDYALVNLSTATFLIDSNYNNTLRIEAVRSAGSTGGHFVYRRGNERLENIINKIIVSIPQLQHDAIINYWLLGSDFLWLQRPMVLSAQEQRWIKNNPVVKVIVNPVDAPVSFQGVNGTFYGINSDLLQLVSLRTGIKFELTSSSDVKRTRELLEDKQASMLGSIIWSEKRSEDMTYTHPWMSAPFVLVVKNEPDAPRNLMGKLTIVTVSGNGIEGQLAAQYPEIQWKHVPNSAMALRLVNEGKVDGAIHTNVGSGFMIQRYFQGKLKIAFVVGNSNAEYGFALRPDERELESILNKTLDDMPPRVFTKIVNKWQGIPEIPLQTWRIYSTQYLITAALAFALLIGCLLWAFSLRRSMKIRQSAQAALQEELNFRESLLQGAPVPVYVINGEGEIISRNAAWEAFFVHTSQKTLALPLYDTRHPLAPVLPALQTAIASPDDGTHEKYEHKLVIRDGETERLLAHWATRLTGNEVRLICGWQDVTAQENLLTAVSHEKDNANLANKAKSTFLATMSHEIRTPVSAIIGLLEIAEQSRTADTPDGEALRLAYLSAQSLLELIGDVLDMSRIESGKLELAPDWGDIRFLLTEVTSVFEGMAKQKQLYLYWETFVDEEFEVFVDFQRLKQVLFNFVGNAIKFTSSGGVRIELRTRFTTDNECELQILVEDTGVGISEEDQARLFVSYSQLDEGKKHAGSGLGLVISSEIMQHMGGKVRLNSQPGFGTTIVIAFSAPYRLKTDEGERCAENELVAVGASTQDIKVLIVDDHSTNRLLLQRQLELLGHRVTAATNGEEVLALCENDSFDLIITDCQMPVMNGFELTRALRRQGSSVIIWGLTANAQQQERDACLEAGMNECVFKPMNKRKLQDLFQYFYPGSDYPLDELRQMVDWENLRSLVMGRDLLVLEMLKDACLENSRDLASILSGVEKKAWPSVKNDLHRLIGAAELIGAQGIKSLCIEFNACLDRGGEASEVDALVIKLAKKLNKLDTLTWRVLKAEQGES